MGEKRKKTGMEVVPSLMDGLKRRALNQQVPLWRVVQDAFEAYLEVEQPSSEIPRHLWKYPDKLHKILASGHPRAVPAITQNLDAFLELIELTARQQEDH